MQMTKETKLKIGKEILMVLAGLLVALLPAPEGLSQNAMTFLGIFVWAVLNWALPVMPSYVSGLLMLLLAVVFHIVPFKTAFSAFAGSTTWLIIGVLSLGSAVNKTGLLSRLSLSIMSLFPPTFRGQAAGLIGAGILIGPFMPSSTAKVSIAGGFATRIGELLGFAPGSKGMNGIFAAMYTGFTLLAPAFITSSYYSYLILGTIPEENASRFTFISWFLTMVPWTIFTALFAFLAISFLFRPDHAALMDKAEIRKMSKELGPMSADEKKTLLILGACVACWVLEKFTGVPAVIPALTGMCLLYMTGVLKPGEINSTINWGVIIFCSCIIGLVPIVSATGINTWMADGIGNIMDSIGSNPCLFILAAAVIVILSRLVLVAGTLVISLMVVILTPFCQAAGMSPWVGGIIAYVLAQQFIFKYQNANFLIAYEAAGGDEKLSHKDMIPYAMVYNIIATGGLFLSIPYWQYLGLIQG